MYNLDHRLVTLWFLPYAYPEYIKYYQENCRIYLDEYNNGKTYERLHRKLIERNN